LPQVFIALVLVAAAVASPVAKPAADKPAAETVKDKRAIFGEWVLGKPF